MNTTNKYIYGFDTIDPISFKEKGTKKLIVRFKNKESDINMIMSTYTINKVGSILSIKSHGSGWTAYPPGTYENRKNANNEATILETFTYENHRLTSIQKSNIKDKKQISLKEFRYESEFLKEEIEEDISKIYTIDKIGRISRIHSTIKMLGDLKTAIYLDFKVNDLNQVSEKKTTYMMGLVSKLDNLMETKELFFYHPNGQLNNAKYSLRDEGKDHTYLTYFNYLDKKSELIESITYIGDEVPASSYRFEYNSKGLLQKSIAKNPEASVTETIYERTYYE